MTYTAQTERETLSVHRNMLIAIGTAVMHAAETKETTWVFAADNDTWRLAAYTDDTQQLHVVTQLDR